MIKTPHEIAEGAMDRLCDYKADVDQDYRTTLDRVAEFYEAFAREAALRLAAVARWELSAATRELVDVINERRQESAADRKKRLDDAVATVNAALDLPT